MALVPNTMSSIEKALQTQGSGTKGDKRAALLALQAVLVDEAKTPDDNDNLSNLVKSEKDRKALKDFVTAALPAALSAAKFGSYVYSIGRVLGPLNENAETLLGKQKVVVEQVLSIYRKAEEVAAINDRPSTSSKPSLKIELPPEKHIVLITSSTSTVLCPACNHDLGVALLTREDLIARNAAAD